MLEIHKRATRRLILCFDGSWFDVIPLGNQLKGNISGIATAVLPVDSHGVSQLVWYHGGVTSGLGLWSRLVESATGEQIKGIIRDAYMFIVNNWVEGSEIYLFGWSRGAYTARIISKLIGEVGILRMSSLEELSGILGELFDPKSSNPQITSESQSSKVSVECIGVWETVGNYGIPNATSVFGISLPFVNRILEWWNNLSNYSFHSNELHPSTKIALQAFAIDEDLKVFRPTLWHTSEKAPNILKQVWFPGNHRSIIGGYPPYSFGDISLLWMLSEVSTLTDLEFDHDFLLQRLQKDAPETPFWGSVTEPVYPLWPDLVYYLISPKERREAGSYKAPDGHAGNEFYHHSVTERIAGTRGRYSAGNEVIERLQKLPYTRMERDLALQAGLVNPAHVQVFWEV